MKEYIIKIDEDKKDIMGNCPLVEKPQELVRCKDCRFGEQRELLREEFKRCKLLGLIKDNDWFCADGEAKESNGR